MNPPPPPPAFVVCDIWMLGVIQASSPWADTSCSPCPSDTSRMGIVVPLISACMTNAFRSRDWRLARHLEDKVPAGGLSGQAPVTFGLTSAGISVLVARRAGGGAVCQGGAMD